MNGDLATLQYDNSLINNSLALIAILIHVNSMIVPEIKFAEKDGFSIAYQVWGEGTETLIYVPGMISHLDVSAESPEYVSFLSRLSENYRVIIFDKRGQGLSDRDSTVPGIESRMDDIDAVADAEKVKSFYLFVIYYFLIYYLIFYYLIFTYPFGPEPWHNFNYLSRIILILSKKKWSPRRETK